MSNTNCTYEPNENTQFGLVKLRSIPMTIQLNN